MLLLIIREVQSDLLQFNTVQDQRVNFCKIIFPVELENLGELAPAQNVAYNSTSLLYPH